MAARYDVVVIGAGPNGLAAAARLARAGRKVVVLERGARPGGLSAPREFHPGYRVPGILHDEALTTRAVAARLDLERQGLRFRARPATYVAAAEGPGITLEADPAQSAAAIAERSRHDADALARYGAFLARLRPLVESVQSTPPPPLVPRGLRELFDLARRGLGLLRLAKADQLELARVAPMCVADFLNERFETPLLVEALAARAVASTWSGPWSAGTTTHLLRAEAAGGEALAGGPAALVAALLAAASAAGAEIRLESEVERIRLERGGVAGVTLAGGEPIDAPALRSTAGPKRTMLALLAPGSLPIAIEDEFRRIRARGSAAKVHLALAGPLELAGAGGARPEAISIGGGHVDELERAFDAIKYRRFSARPHLDVRVPTVADPALAPAGHHVVSILASFAPHHLEGGWTGEARRAFGEAVVERLAAHAPAARERLVAMEVLTPHELAGEFALSGGQLHHGEHALDQLLVMRPAPCAARYATPVPGLWLGGAGSHPGGGVRPTAGLLAAEALLAAR